ncbi:hypothetical protein Trydic_g13008 [Trypoxylus dichotomus]
MLCEASGASPAYYPPYQVQARSDVARGTVAGVSISQQPSLPELVSFAYAARASCCPFLSFRRALSSFPANRIVCVILGRCHSRWRILPRDGAVGIGRLVIKF